MPAAARIALTSASATGLRSTLAMPGRASSSEESCDPPSSAGIEQAAPALKVAASYNPPSGASRILAPGASPQGVSEGGRGRSTGDDELGMGKQLTQDGTGTRIEGHLEVEIELRSEERRVGKER